MNLPDPAILMAENAEIDNPDVGKTSRKHDPSEPLGVGNATFMQVKAATFLVREEGFNAHPFAIPVAGFFDQLEVGDEIDRLGTIGTPP